MRRALPILTVILCLTACADPAPSWRIDWETPADRGVRLPPVVKPGNDDGKDGEGPDKPQPYDVDTMPAFAEEFSESISSCFSFNEKDNDFRYFPGFPSLTEESTDILMLRLDPSDPAGSGNGAVLCSKAFTGPGSYSIRMKLPDISKAQPKLGAIFSFNVSGIDRNGVLNSIEMQWRLASPSIIYMSAATGKQTAPVTAGRIVNPADGSIISTTTDGTGVETDGPGSITAIKDFDASSRFYTYGFDWKEDRLEWWVSADRTGSRTVLLSIVNDGGFAMPGPLSAGFYHSADTPAIGVDGSTQAPRYPFELEIDSISYIPY